MGLCLCTSENSIRQVCGSFSLCFCLCLRLCRGCSHLLCLCYAYALVRTSLKRSIFGLKRGKKAQCVSNSAKICLNKKKLGIMGTNLSCTVIFLTVSLFHSVVFGLIKTGLIRSSLLNHQETCNKGWKRVQNSCTCSCASRLSTDSPFVLSSHFIFPECSLAYVKRFSGNEISVLLRLFCCNHKFTLFATFLIQCY